GAFQADGQENRPCSEQKQVHPRKVARGREPDENRDVTQQSCPHHQKARPDQGVPASLHTPITISPSPPRQVQSRVFALSGRAASSSIEPCQQTSLIGPKSQGTRAQSRMRSRYIQKPGFRQVLDC